MKRKRKRYKRKPPKQNSSKGFPLSTLCWCCANAITEGCSWSKNFTPVEGWEATPTIIKEGVLLKVDENGNTTKDTTPRLSHSFKVHKCPEFVEDCTPRELGLVRNNKPIT